MKALTFIHELFGAGVAGEEFTSDYTDYDIYVETDIMKKTLHIKGIRYAHFDKEIVIEVEER